MIAIGHGRPADEELPRRRELAELLGCARDLDGDYASTIELARYLQTQRAKGGQSTDVEAAGMSGSRRVDTAVVQFWLTAFWIALSDALPWH